MPRIARTVIPGVSYHLTQRGNNRQDVFFVDDDRRRYLELLAENAERYGLTVRGYCLMTNHVHLIAIPHAEDSLAKAVGRTHWRYTQLINHLHGRDGHLWKNRFDSCGLDDRHLVAAMRYVEMNPVRARLVRRPWRYRWSSAAAHVGLRKPDATLSLADWDYSPAEWRRMLEEALPDDEVQKIRRATSRGRPLGSDAFLSKIEHAVGRRLRARPVGRPRK